MSSKLDCHILLAFAIMPARSVRACRPAFPVSPRSGICRRDKAHLGQLVIIFLASQDLQLKPARRPSACGRTAHIGRVSHTDCSERMCPTEISPKRLPRRPVVQYPLPASALHRGKHTVETTHTVVPLVLRTCKHTHMHMHKHKHKHKLAAQRVCAVDQCCLLWQDLSSLNHTDANSLAVHIRLSAAAAPAIP